MFSRRIREPLPPVWDLRTPTSPQALTPHPHPSFQQIPASPTPSTRPGEPGLPTPEQQLAPAPAMRTRPAEAGTRGSRGEAPDFQRQNPAPNAAFATRVGAGREVPAPDLGIQRRRTSGESLTGPTLALWPRRQLGGHHALARRALQPPVWGPRAAATPNHTDGPTDAPPPCFLESHASWKFTV